MPPVYLASDPVCVVAGRLSHTQMISLTALAAQILPSLRQLSTRLSARSELAGLTLSIVMSMRAAVMEWIALRARVGSVQAPGLEIACHLRPAP